MTVTPPMSIPMGAPERPRSSLRRTLVVALTCQSLVVLVLTLVVLVAGAGIEQRLLLAFALVLIVALAAGLAASLSKRILRPLDRLANWGKALASGSSDAVRPADLENDFGALAAALSSLADGRSPSQARPEKGRVEERQPNGSQLAERKELESLREDLNTAEQVFQSLLTNLPWPLLITDAGGAIVKHNAAAALLLGREQAHLHGQKIENYFARHSAPEQVADWRQHQKDARVWHGDLTVEAPDGRCVFLEVTSVPLGDPRQDPGASVYVAVDVTEARQLQSLVIDMERLSTRGRMAGEIAHEINNFLTILGGNLDIIPMLLAAGNQEKVNLKFVAMKQVLEKIARFSDGLMGCRDNDSEPTPCDINRLIESLVAFLKPQNRYDGIEFTLQADPDLPKVVVKVGLIQQVMVNLLNNAADAVREVQGSRGTIDIGTRWLADRQQIAISVRDNGQGLSAAASSRVFKERYSDKQTGHGLGLISCHKIAQLHGGTLSVESVEGSGATFTLVLPKAPETALAVPRSQAATLSG